MSLPPLPATTGHGKTLFTQTPDNKCGQHFFHVAADAGDHPNPTVGQFHFL
jgi:hypothetical protein